MLRFCNTYVRDEMALKLILRVIKSINILLLSLNKTLYQDLTFGNTGYYSAMDGETLIARK